MNISYCLQIGSFEADFEDGLSSSKFPSCWKICSFIIINWCLVSMTGM